MSDNSHKLTGLDPQDGVYRTSAGLPRAFLGSPEAATVLRSVAFAVMVSAIAASVAVVILAMQLPPEEAAPQMARAGSVAP